MHSCAPDRSLRQNYSSASLKARYGFFCGRYFPVQCPRVLHAAISFLPFADQSDIRIPEVRQEKTWSGRFRIRFCSYHGNFGNERLVVAGIRKLLFDGRIGDIQDRIQLLIACGRRIDRRCQDQLAVFFRYVLVRKCADRFSVYKLLYALVHGSHPAFCRHSLHRVGSTPSHLLNPATPSSSICAFSAASFSAFTAAFSSS